MTGRRLKEHAPGLWTALGRADVAYPKLFQKFDFSTRMTIVRLSDGGLFLHSPIRLDDGLREELDGLGEVRAVAAPNRAHHLFVGDCREAYPNAKIYAAPGLPEKRKDFRFDGLLADEPRIEWRGDLEQRRIQGMPMLNEVAFFHPSSRTLILTDLAFNIPKGQPWGIPVVTKLLGVGGRVGPSRLGRWLIRDKEATRASLGIIMRWDFDRLIMAHGDVVEAGGKQKLRDAFGFILGAASRMQ